ncbi:MAG: hypothetical protein ACO3JG_13260 [Luteolibacter sp.]
MTITKPCMMPFVSLAIASAAWAAAPVSIPNASFDESSASPPAGWTKINGGAATWAATTTQYNPLTLVDGANVASVYRGAAGDGLSQVLTATLQADATYTLTVKVGDPADEAFDGYTIQLLANGSVLAQDDNTQTPANGDFATATVTYAYQAGDAALVGQPLEIRLLSKGLSSGDVNFDKVQLSATLGSPAADPGGPYTVFNGGSLSLDGSGSLPSDGQAITGWEWDLDNDGDFDEAVSGATPVAISYDDLQSVHGMVIGNNTIKLRVTDDSSPTPKTSTTEGTVTILPPTAIFASTLVQPTINGADIAYWNANSPSTAPGQDKWFYENTGAGQPKGQTFTVTQNVLLKAVSFRLRSTKKAPVNNYLVRIGTVDTATNTFNLLHSEVVNQPIYWNPDNATDCYGIWTLATPVVLPVNPVTGSTLYAFDVTFVGPSNTDWQGGGIPYPLFENTNVYAGGNKSTTALGGAAGIPTNTMQMDSGRDREFHIDMDATAIVDTTAPTLTAIDDQVGGGPIYEDQVQVTYILNFDEPVNEATIDLADFENLGSGVNIDSVVSAVQTKPYPLASAVSVVFGISGTGTLKLGLKSGSNIADHAGNPVNSPVADDATITVLAGTTPGLGNRWWDLATSGVTDGTSQGGTGNWNTATTNWDRGLGFANPVAWVNAGGETAIFGGTPGTVTLDTDITLDGLTFQVVDGGGTGYFIGHAAEDNRLTFGGDNVITLNATGTNSNQDATIRAGIDGSPTLNIHGRANNSQFFALEPTADVTMTLGVVNMYNTNASNKQLRLGGSSTGNVVDKITWTVTGNQLQVRKQSPVAGATATDWTINQDISLDDGRIYVDEGTLVLGGTNNFCSHSIEIASGGRIALQGNWRIHDENEDFRVLSGGIVAPGVGVGTVTFNWNSSRNDPSVGLVDLRTGSTYEWEVGASATDVIALTEPVANGNAELVVSSGTTLKVVDAGGSPSAGDKLTVFTCASGVVYPDAATLQANMTIDISSTSWTGTPTWGIDVDGETGDATIYLTGLSGGSPPADPYDTWATGGELFGDDANGDGVSNGLAFLLGAASPSADALGLLPTVTETSGGLVMSFIMRGAASRGNATLNVEHSSDLGVADPWTTVAVPDTSGGPTDGVTFEVSGSEMLEVRATIGSDQASGGKLFGRLKATE